MKEAKDKAEELIEKMSFETARVCALICVDEILKHPTPKQKKYWELVKQEILNRQ